LRSDEARRRHAVFTRWHQARRNGLTATYAAQAVGVSRATLYRWNRRAEPIYSQRGFEVSNATVGRVITHFIKRGRTTACPP